MDCAAAAVSEKEFRGVSIHVKLIVGGDDLEAIINDILVEYGGASFFVGIVEPAKPWVYSQHWAPRC